MQNSDLLINLIFKASWYSDLYYHYIYLYALGIILAIIIIIRDIGNDGGQAKHRR